MPEEVGKDPLAADSMVTPLLLVSMDAQAPVVVAAAGAISSSQVDTLATLDTGPLGPDSMVSLVEMMDVSTRAVVAAGTRLLSLSSP